MQVKKKLAALASVFAAPLIGGSAGVAVAAFHTAGPPAEQVTVVPAAPGQHDVAALLRLGAATRPAGDRAARDDDEMGQLR